jgi:hypothetical protein
MTLRSLVISLAICALVIGLQLLALAADWVTATP